MNGIVFLLGCCGNVWRCLGVVVVVVVVVVDFVVDFGREIAEVYFLTHRFRPVMKIIMKIVIDTLLRLFGLGDSQRC